MKSRLIFLFLSVLTASQGYATTEAVTKNTSTNEVIPGGVSGTASFKMPSGSTFTLDSGATMEINGNVTGLLWSEIGNTPTTIAGYGITDPYVSGITDTDGSLTIVQTGNSYAVSINLNHQNIWESGQTFGANILLDDTNNIAPNQTLTGSSSILNEGLGDGRYSPLAGSSSITTLGSVTAGAIPLGLVTGIDASVAAALPNSPSGGSGIILLTDGDGTNVNLSGNSTVTNASHAYTADTADAYSGPIELNQIDGLDSSNITPLEFGINTASGFVTQTGGDARYLQKGDTIFAQTTTDISQTGTTLTDTSLTLTLTPGTYEITCSIDATTASTTAGIEVRLNDTDADTHQIQEIFGRGESINTMQPYIFPHFGQGGEDHGAIFDLPGDAPATYGSDYAVGRLTIAATETLTVLLGQRSAEDDANPAILKAGSWLKAVRQ